MWILIGGLNGTGKSTLCETLARKFGLKCQHVPPLCYREDSFTPLSFEIYSLQAIASRVYLGDVVDDSPLTVALYLKALPLYSQELNVEEEVYEEIAKGAIEFSKELKGEGFKFVWLTAPIATILQRLRRSEECPLRSIWNSDPIELGTLSSLEKSFLNEVRDVVDLVLDTGSKGPEELAEEVMKVVNKD